MIGLTPRQSELFGFIQEVIAGHGYAPSFDEMKRAMGVKNKSTVFFLIKALEERGRIRRDYGVTRGIDVLAHMADGTPLQFIPIGATPLALVGDTGEGKLSSRPSVAVAAAGDSTASNSETHERN